MSKANPGDSSLESLVEEGFSAMLKATRVTNTFPIGASYELFQSYTDFNVLVSRLTNNVLLLTNRIMKGEASTTLKRDDDDESNQERLSECLDSIVDRVSVPAGAGAGPARDSGPATASWNRKPTLATVQMKSAGLSLIGAKNITRPQLSFREPVDNSDSVFVPRISHKPNALRPLDLTLRYGPDLQPIGYEHPYALELLEWRPPAWALATGAGSSEVRALQDTPLTMVQCRDTLDALLAHLHCVRELAVDLEHHSYRTYLGLTCLIQISTDEGGDFIVDALALRDHLHLLNDVFTHPDKIKVFHGADQDVLWLQRDFGVYVVGMFDTHQAARALRLPHASLKHLLERYCGVRADKTHQLADWRMRPLPAELLLYARQDTHYLLRVWRCMRDQLEPRALLDVFRASQLVAATTYNKPALRADSHLALYARSGKRWGAAQLSALRAVWAWRDAHARALDESPAYLLPNHMVLAMCEALPRDLQGLRALADPPPPFLLHHMHDLHQIILASRCVPETPGAVEAAVRRMWVPVARLRPHHDLPAVPDVPDTMPAVPDTPPPDVPDASHNRSHGSVGRRPVCVPDVPGVPDVPALFATTHHPQRRAQSAEAASFQPPYLRYQVYRRANQMEQQRALQAAGERAVVVLPEPEPEPEPGPHLYRKPAAEPAPPEPGADTPTSAPVSPVRAARGVRRRPHPPAPHTPHKHRKH